MNAEDIDKSFLKHAIELARQARAAGNHPFGALLVLDGRVVLTARNTVATDGDATAHAEANLITSAIRQFSSDKFCRTFFHKTLLPSLMCSGEFVFAYSSLARL